jgi:phosphoribosylformylglycinamidine synthase
MWSEHCSYKSSRRHLRKFPVTGPRVVHGPGENAGVVDIGDGQVAVFKMESHNHPSFIEPYQGAATGVGGIMRDVFTMGARPIALLNALRFGDPEHPKTRRLLSGVVAGIGGYGNCVGVPTVGGRDPIPPGLQRQHPGERHVRGPGRRRQDLPVRRSCARSAGRLLRLEDGPRRHPRRHHGLRGVRRRLRGEAPTVQVGDPFAEKLLIEATLELMATGAVAAIQDMGRAGLTSSSWRWPARATSGSSSDLDAVPQRETGMSAYEMMLSESQERMLAILKPGREPRRRRSSASGAWTPP